MIAPEKARAIMKRFGMTSFNVSTKIQINPTTMSKWLNNKESMTVDKLVLLEEYLIQFENIKEPHINTF